MTSKCVNCYNEFKEGDHLQAFLRSPECKEGSWGNTILVDAGFQKRHASNQDTIKRRHIQCSNEQGVTP